jgi:hypothetical protein
LGPSKKKEERGKYISGQTYKTEWGGKKGEREKPVDSFIMRG